MQQFDDDYLSKDENQQHMMEIITMRKPQTRQAKSENRAGDADKKRESMPTKKGKVTKDGASLSHDVFDVETNDDGKIVDFLSDSGDSPQLLEPKPEEFVRQRYLRILHAEYGYPKDVLAREVPIWYGGKEAKDKDGNPVRADIVVYADAEARKKRDPGRIEVIVECKRPTVEEGYEQLVSYIFNTSANGAVWYNQSEEPKYFRRKSIPKNELLPDIGIPRYKQTWDALGIQKKGELKRPKDIKGLLRICHNKIHGRGNDGDDADLTMDMVRIILAKAKDEELPGNNPLFYCTSDEYASQDGRQNVLDRIQDLFKKVVAANPGVFQKDERITIGATAVCDVVTELQRFRLMSDLYQATDWDLMGHAYEQYTATYLKRQKGQFFTNRLVTDFMVQILDPEYSDVILDPAGGAGGFLTATMRYVRKKILDRASEQHKEQTSSGMSGGQALTAGQRQLDIHRTKMFMVETSKRLVKIAKTAMILNGDGHAGMTHGDSLGPYEKMDKVIQGHAGRGTPNIILTNPPFAGIGEGRIKDEKVLNNYACGMKWTDREGKLEMAGTNEEGVPPEMLFFERCMDWVAPGGKVGIVMPKAFLDTQTYQTARSILLTNFRLLAVINCDKNTFQPHTGVRTCIVFFQRPEEGEKVSEDYDVFMGVSRRVGQDSEGMPIFKLDSDNHPTNDLDEDLSEILADWKDFKKGTLTPSEYRFKIRRSDISSETLSINPQFYLPELNKTIKDLEAVDGKCGWTVVPLSQIQTGTRIFKAPRMKTENLIAEGTGPTFETYHTPSSVLQEKGEAAKNIDISRATSKQLAAIKNLRVHRGDILITRSGTIGRVAYATKRIEGMILSDDMIRVRIPDENIRMYAYAFLQSRTALNQMLKNEYGTIQQHLEAKHIQGILIPIPPSWDDVKPLVDEVKRGLRAREELESANAKTTSATKAFVEFLVTESHKEGTDKTQEQLSSELSALLESHLKG